MTWSHVSQAVPLPDHHAAFNTRATMVSGRMSAAAVLPAHQAAMVLEPRSDHAYQNGSFRYAINVGTDGDLSRNWQLVSHWRFVRRPARLASERAREPSACSD